VVVLNYSVGIAHDNVAKPDVFFIITRVRHGTANANHQDRLNARELQGPGVAGSMNGGAGSG
jgi:hypothetical protein